MKSAKNKEVLSKSLITRIKKFKRELGEVEPSDLEITLENFRQDPNRDKEILWWEDLTKRFLDSIKNQDLTLNEKKDVFKIMFLEAYSTSQKS